MLEDQKTSDASPLDYRILIIDDDLDFAASLRLILENENYQPLLAHSEEEALEVIGKNAVGCVLFHVGSTFRRRHRGVEAVRGGAKTRHGQRS